MSEIEWVDEGGMPGLLCYVFAVFVRWLSRHSARVHSPFLLHMHTLDQAPTLTPVLNIAP